LKERVPLSPDADSRVGAREHMAVETGRLKYPVGNAEVLY